MFENLLQTNYNKSVIGYENICNVLKNIYHGNQKSLEYIKYFNIQLIISIEKDNSNNKHKNLDNVEDNLELIKITIKKEDKLIKFYDKIWDLFEKNYKKNILIQCEDGSISLLLLLSYLIAYKYYTYESAFEYILVKKHNEVNISLLNKDYLDELIELDKDLRHFRNKISI